MPAPLHQTLAVAAVTLALAPTIRAQVPRPSIGAEAAVEGAEGCETGLVTGLDATAVHGGVLLGVEGRRSVARELSDERRLVAGLLGVELPIGLTARVRPAVSLGVLSVEPPGTPTARAFGRVFRPRLGLSLRLLLPLVRLGELELALAPSIRFEPRLAATSVEREGPAGVPAELAPVGGPSGGFGLALVIGRR